MSDREDVRELLRELLKEALANGDGRRRRAARRRSPPCCGPRPGAGRRRPAR